MLENKFDIVSKARFNKSHRNIIVLLYSLSTIIIFLISLNFLGAFSLVVLMTLLIGAIIIERLINKTISIGEIQFTDEGISVNSKLINIETIKKLEFKLYLSTSNKIGKGKLIPKSWQVELLKLTLKNGLKKSFYIRIYPHFGYRENFATIYNLIESLSNEWDEVEIVNIA